MKAKFGAEILLIAALVLGLSGCSDLDKYQKTAETKPAPEPQVRSVDIKGTPEERERGRQFKERLDAVRVQLTLDHDTSATLMALDRLLVEAETEQQKLRAGSEFGMFYLLASADILNGIAQLRRAIGDEQGARSAEERLETIAKMLPL